MTGWWRFSFLIKVLKRLKPINIGWKSICMNYICRCFGRRKGTHRIQRLVDFKTKQLDIRSLIANSITLKDYFRCSLTRQ